MLHIITAMGVYDVVDRNGTMQCVNADFIIHECQEYLMPDTV